jgi:hypothetical protein
MKDIVLVRKFVKDLLPSDYNPRTIDANSFAGLRESITKFGFVEPIVWNKRTGNVVGGHQRCKVLNEMGVVETDVVEVDMDETHEIALNITLNSPAVRGDWDDSTRSLLQEIGDELPEMFQAVRIDDLLKSLGGEEKKKDASEEGGDGDTPPEENEEEETHPDTENELLSVPPLTTLDQRKPYWRERRAEMVRNGICGDNDPVLPSLLLEWFCPSGGTVLDLYGDDPSWGIATGISGGKYIGITTSEKQSKRNIDVFASVKTKRYLSDNTEDITPIQMVDEFIVKRDDLYCVANARGAKARACVELCSGSCGVVAAVGLTSPLSGIVARIAGRLGVPCRVHTNKGDMTSELLDAKNHGAEIIQHQTDFITDAIAKAKEDAAARGWTEIPANLESDVFIRQMAEQVINIPDVSRIVVPVGSGMSLAGILHGLKDSGREIPVLGVVVGVDPDERLNQYAPAGWREMVTLVKCSADKAECNMIGDILLDSSYEAKCLPYLDYGDLLWVVGLRNEEVVVRNEKETQTPLWKTEIPEEASDMVVMVVPKVNVFTEEIYGKIEAAVKNLKDGRMACVLFEDVENEDGFSSCLSGKIIKAFESQGMRLYNEAIFLQDKPWIKGKLGRKGICVHKSLLVFFKGEPKTIKSEFGAMDLSGLEQTLVADPTETLELVELE